MWPSKDETKNMCLRMVLQEVLIALGFAQGKMKDRRHNEINTNLVVEYLP